MDNRCALLVKFKRVSCSFQEKKRKGKEKRASVVSRGSKIGGVAWSKRPRERNDGERRTRRWKKRQEASTKGSDLITDNGLGETRVRDFLIGDHPSNKRRKDAMIARSIGKQRAIPVYIRVLPFKNGARGGRSGILFVEENCSKRKLFTPYTTKFSLREFSSRIPVSYSSFQLWNSRF